MDNHRYTPLKPKTNEDLIRDLLNYNPTGAVCQAFIVHAIQSYADSIAATPVDQIKSSLVHAATWKRCAEHIKGQMDAFYNRPLRALPKTADDGEVAP